jgi:hypothetical protein
VGRLSCESRSRRKSSLQQRRAGWGRWCDRRRRFFHAHSMCSNMCLHNLQCVRNTQHFRCCVLLSARYRITGLTGARCPLVKPQLRYLEPGSGLRAPGGLGPGGGAVLAPKPLAPSKRPSCRSVSGTRNGVGRLAGSTGSTGCRVPCAMHVPCRMLGS